jgi:hypothetical protein
VLSRRPVPRPADVIALELVLSVATALQVGILMWLSVGTWEDRGVGSGPIVGVLGFLAIAVTVGWLLWLLDGNGWILAAANVPVALLMLFVILLGFGDDQIVRVGTWVAVFSFTAALLGIGCGVFLPGPTRERWGPEPRVRARPGGPPVPAPRTSPTFRRAVAALPTSVSVPRRVPSTTPEAAAAGAAGGAAAGTAVAGATAKGPGAKGSTAKGPAAKPTEPSPVLQARPGASIKAAAPSDVAAPVASTTSAPAPAAGPVDASVPGSTSSPTTSTPPTGTRSPGSAAASAPATTPRIRPAGALAPAASPLDRPGTGPRPLPKPPEPADEPIAPGSTAAGFAAKPDPELRGLAPDVAAGTRDPDLVASPDDAPTVAMPVVQRSDAASPSGAASNHEEETQPTLSLDDDRA